MQRRKLLVILAAAAIASVIAVALAASGTIYTWEKTFEVTEAEPEIECEIEVSDCRIVGCPVKVWVCLRLDCCCRDGWEDFRYGWKHKFDDDWEDECDDCEDCMGCRCWGRCCQVNGTYSAHLYWWNETHEDWQHVMHLQEETNITLTCWKYIQTYTFTPEWMGEYKVVVTFAMDSVTYNFTNED